MIDNEPRSAKIARRGVKNTQDFAEMMSALMSDIIEKKIPPDVANAAVKAGQQMLKVVEMQIRWGGDNSNNLALINGDAKELPSAEVVDDQNEEDEAEATISLNPAKYIQPVIDPTIEDQKEIERENAKERSRMRSEITKSLKKKDLKKAAAQSLAAVDEFDNWCIEKGYGVIAASHPKLPEIVDEYEDEKEAKAKAKIPDPKSADFEHESGMIEEFDEYAAGDVVDLESIREDVHDNG